MHISELSHSFPMYPLPNNQKDYKAPPVGTEARCGFKVPEWWTMGETGQPRAHNPETDQVCEECKRREILSIQAKQRALAVLQQKVSM